MDESTQIDKVFHDDPVYMKSLVGKQVEVKTVDDKTHSGIVYVIDPIFKTIVLHSNFRDEEVFETIFILHHAIESLKIVSNEVKESYVIEGNINSELEYPTKKTIVRKWLKHMLIDVNESGDYLKIDDHLVIVPPYGPENCLCSNTIILDRIQNILSQMPPEFS